MDQQLRHAVAIIDLDAVSGNFERLRRMAGESTVMAMIKGDAYGHGAIPVARALRDCGAQHMAVAVASEAMQLRGAGIDTPLLMLSPPPAAYATELAEKSVALSVYSEEYARELSAALAGARGLRLDVHIKVDTGMSRMGILCQSEAGVDSAAGAIKRIAGLPGLNLRGIMTHFSTADEQDSTHTDRQYALFLALMRRLSDMGVMFEWRHAAATGGMINHPDKYLNMVRPGLMLFGVAPQQGVTPPPGIKPAMTLRSRIVDVKRLPAGAAVSYGRTYTAARDMELAVVSIGYADGYPRANSNRSRMLVRGAPAPVVGGVCMDYTMLDVTGLSAKRWDSVTVFGVDESGAQLPAALVAADGGSISYELVTRVGARVERQYISQKTR